MAAACEWPPAVGPTGGGVFLAAVSERSVYCGLDVLGFQWLRAELAGHQPVQR